MTKKPTVYAQGVYATEKDARGTRITEMSIKVDKFVEFLTNNVDAKGYVKISLWPKREVDKFGSHNAILNDWRPDGYGSNQGRQQSGNPYKQEEGSDDLPF
jgi:hypothetical protein